MPFIMTLPPLSRACPPPPTLPSPALWPLPRVAGPTSQVAGSAVTLWGGRASLLCGGRVPSPPGEGQAGEGRGHRAV